MNIQTKMLIGISTVAIIIAAFYSGLVVSEYEVESDKISSQTEIKIVLVSDLHSSIYGEEQSKIRRLIKEQKPDIIALSGDISDRRRSIEGAKQFIDAIADIAPVYYVTGNHEASSGHMEEIKRIYIERGVHVLEGEYEEVYIEGQKLVLGGIDDPLVYMNKANGMDWENKWKEDLAEAFSSLDQEESYSILLSHRPEYVDTYKRRDFDMVLSGHTHGGQVRIPLILKGLFAPNQGFFPKYAGGLYEHGNMIHIVSRGASFKLMLPRIFNPPEVVSITVRGVKKQ